MKNLARIAAFIIATTLALRGQPTPPSIQTVTANSTTGLLGTPGNFFTNASNAAAIFTAIGMPSQTGNNGKTLTTNGNSMSWSAAGAGSVTSIPDGSTNGVTWTVATRTTTPTFTFSLGAITPTTVNGDTITTGTGTLTLGSKTLVVSNSLTLAGTDSTTMTFPTTSATIARTDAANTFTGHQTIEGVTTTGATGTGNLVFSASPTLTGTIAGASMSLSSLTSGRVHFSTTAGLFTDAASLTFNSGTGALSATSFVGAGTSLTGIPYTITGTSGQITASAGTGNITLSIPSAMTGINSVTAASSTNLTLNGGSGSLGIASSSGAILTGTVASLSGIARSDATITINRATGHAMIDLYNSGTGSSGGEESVVNYSAKDAGNNILQLGSASMIWADATAGTGRSMYRIHGNHIGGGSNSDFRLTADGGIELFGTSDTSWPGAGVLKINGTLNLTGASTFGGDIAANSRLVFSTVAEPSAVGQMGYSAALGIYLLPKGGSTSDITIYNHNGVVIQDVAAGAIGTNFYGALTVSAAGSGGSVTINRTDGAGFLNVNASNGLTGFQLGATGTQGATLSTNVGTSAVAAQNWYASGGTFIGTSPSDPGANNVQIRGTLAVGGTGAFTGDLTAPTQSAGNSSTKVATTAFVAAATFQSETTLTDASTITWTLVANQADQNSKVTLAGNRTLATPTNLAGGMRGNLRVIQDSTGSRTLTLPANSKVIAGGAGAVTLTTAANAVDILSWYSPDGTLIEWTIGKNFN